MNWLLVTLAVLLIAGAGFAVYYVLTHQGPDIPVDPVDPDDPKSKCEKDSTMFWNGYDCVKKTPDTCGLYPDQGTTPKCAQGQDKWWYINAGGPDAWAKDSGAKCFAAKDYNHIQAGHPASFSDGAPCISAHTEDKCNELLKDYGCGGGN